MCAFLINNNNNLKIIVNNSEMEVISQDKNKTSSLKGEGSAGQS